VETPLEQFRSLATCWAPSSDLDADHLRAAGAIDRSRDTIWRGDSTHPDLAARAYSLSFFFR
jgi:hypothetical protein